MLQQLDIPTGASILEVGTGTGYNAALLTALAGPEGHVTTIEIDPELAEQARRRLRVARMERAEVIAGDGADAAVPRRTFDRILVTASAADVYPAWLDALTPGGLLVLPLAFNGGMQVSVAFRKRRPVLRSESVRPCSFVELRGTAAARSRRVIRLGEGKWVTVGGATTVSDAAAVDLLTGPARVVATVNGLSAGEALVGLAWWLSLHDQPIASMRAAGEPEIAGSQWLSGGRSNWSSTATVGLMDSNAACFLARAQYGARARRLLQIVAYGQATVLIRQLIEAIRSWQRVGKPRIENLEISAYLAAQELPTVGSGALVMRRQSVALVCRWRSPTPAPG